MSADDTRQQRGFPIAYLQPVTDFDDNLYQLLTAAILPRRCIQGPDLRFLLPCEQACTMPNPRSFHSLFYELQDINPGKRRGGRGRVPRENCEYDDCRERDTHFVVRMTCSTPPALAFPLSLVKSSTWFTVSTSDVPHAWTVCKKDDWV